MPKGEKMAAGPNVLWYGNLSSRGIRPGLDNEIELLERLGRPQDHVRFIHVAGTDGKGSVCAMIESILVRSGMTVGSFISPEISRVNECIRLCGNEIDDADLEQILGDVRVHADAMAREGRECTSFEVLTAAALLFFNTVSTEIAVMEVGMGGRLDATNVIVPDVTVINNIGMEHTRFLGDTIESIAMEKAGIMKPGVPCVTLNDDEVFVHLLRHSEEVGCPISRVDPSEISVVSSNIDSVEIGYRGFAYTVGIPGRHQARNAVLAIEAVRLLGDYRDRIEPYVFDGLEEVSWPCRMQKFLAHPIVVDVTHTSGGAVCLARDVSELYGKVVLVFGMLSDKDVDAVSRALAPVCSKVFATQPDSPRAMSADLVAETMGKYHEVDGTYRSLTEAMGAAMDARGDEVILVTGSFRMAEGVLKWIARSSRFSTYSQRNTWAEHIRGAIRRD